MPNEINTHASAEEAQPTGGDLGDLAASSLLCLSPLLPWLCKCMAVAIGMQQVICIAIAHHADAGQQKHAQCDSRRRSHEAFSLHFAR
jgi:hypothetical protein